MRINWIGVRNFLIIAALAGLVFVSQEGFGATMSPGEMPRYDFRFNSMTEMVEAHKRLSNR